MRRFLFVFALLFVFCFGCKSDEPAFSREPQEQRFAQAYGDSAVRDAEIAEGAVMADPARLAPDFTLYDIYQDAYTLSGYRDKQPVLLLFWTTWCPFCRKELKVLNGMYSSLAADGIEVFSVNVGELPGTVENFVQNYSLSYRVLLDRDSRVATSYGLIGVPSYVLINKSGEVVFRDNYFPASEYKGFLDRR